MIYIRREALKGALRLIFQVYMTIETLVVTVDQNDHRLVDQMNIQTDVLIGNQCLRDTIEHFTVNGNAATCFCTTDRGVGVNRNLLLDKSKADVCVLADDDMTFIDGYPEIAKQALRECPDADVVIFNLIEKNPQRYINKKKIRVRWYNYSKYGAARIAFKRDSINNAGIRFNQSFGGGAYYCSGEDSVFLRDCLKKGLHIYAVPYALAQIDQESKSTWFKGYTERFFYDKGALYACLYKDFWFPFVLRFVLKRVKKLNGSISVAAALSSAVKGAKEYKALTTEEKN